jgi:hypothetical protein
MHKSLVSSVAVSWLRQLPPSCVHAGYLANKPSLAPQTTGSPPALPGKQYWAEYLSLRNKHHTKHVSHRYMVYDAPDWGTLGPSNSTHIQQHICSKSNTPSICVIASIRDSEPLNSHSRQLCQNKSTKELTSAVAPSPHYQSRSTHAFLSTIMHNCKLPLDAGAVGVGAAPTCTQPNRRPRWPVIADEAGLWLQ